MCQRCWQRCQQSSCNNYAGTVDVLLSCHKGSTSRYYKHMQVKNSALIQFSTSRCLATHTGSRELNLWQQPQASFSRCPAHVTLVPAAEVCSNTCQVVFMILNACLIKLQI